MTNAQLYRDREEWRDVTGIPQKDVENPVVPIDYSERFSDAMDYFRGVVAIRDMSERALRLTADVISNNAANYSVWHYRRLILTQLDADLRREIDFIDSMASGNAKNYQLWYHRRWVAEKMGESCCRAELAFTETVLSDDAKNYHAWSHRQWVLRTYGGWEEELSFCERLLEDDVLNNSAWNERYFVLKNSPLLKGVSGECESEVAFCTLQLKRVPTNESAWRYLRGLFIDDLTSMASNAAVLSLLRSMLRLHRDNVHALSLFLELVTYGLELESGDCAMLCLPQCSALKASQQLCDRLSELDPIRANYWAFRRSLLP